MAGAGGILSGVVAFVKVRQNDGTDASAAVKAKLVQLGASVARAFGDKVTHVVFKGRDDDLLALHDRVAKSAAPAQLVSPLWLSSCEAEGRRALERSALLPRPAAPDPLMDLLSPLGAGKKRRRRSGAIPPPRAPASFVTDLSSPQFNSAARAAAGGDAAPWSIAPAAKRPRMAATPNVRRWGASPTAPAMTPPPPWPATAVAMDCDVITATVPVHRRVTDSPPPPSPLVPTTRDNARLATATPVIAAPRRLSVTGADAATIASVVAAAKALPGAVTCLGRERGRVTHLILGETRRTLKVLLAIAGGAHLLDPAWVTDSVAAGQWLPEGQYHCAAFPGAAVARAARERGAPPPLDGWGIYLGGGPSAACASHDAPGPSPSGLASLVTALGGRVEPLAAAADIAIVAGRGRPLGLRLGAPTLAPEWLLQAAETFSLPAGAYGIAP